jgi:hypothetical protein
MKAIKGGMSGCKKEWGEDTGSEGTGCIFFFKRASPETRRSSFHMVKEIIMENIRAAQGEIDSKCIFRDDKALALQNRMLDILKNIRTLSNPDYAYT